MVPGARGRASSSLRVLHAERRNAAKPLGSPGALATLFRGAPSATYARASRAYLDSRTGVAENARTRAVFHLTRLTLYGHTV